MQITLNEMDPDARVRTSGLLADLAPTEVFDEQLLDERVIPASP